MSDLTAKEALTTLFAGTDDPYVTTDMLHPEPEKASETVVQWMSDAGFEIRPVQPSSEFR